jgi:transposase-like protein
VFIPNREARIIPQSLSELAQLYSTPEACLTWTENLESCPNCGGKLWWRRQRMIWRCSSCGKDVPFSTLTAWDGSHVLLPRWFEVAWYLAAEPVAVRQLKRLTGLALTSLHPIVRTFKAEMTAWTENQVLSGEVEVDEAFLDWNGKQGRGSRPAVMLLAERGGEGGILTKSGVIGRTLAVNVDDTTAKTCQKIIRQFVKTGSDVYTDAWAGYKRLPKLGYDHTVLNISKSGEDLHKHLPEIHKADSELRNSFRVYHRHPTMQYFPLYLSEWSWRYSHRKLSTGERWALLVRMINKRRTRD